MKIKVISMVDTYQGVRVLHSIGFNKYHQPLNVMVLMSFTQVTFEHYLRYPTEYKSTRRRLLLLVFDDIYSDCCERYLSS